MTQGALLTVRLDRRSWDQETVICEGVVRRWLNRIASRGPFYQTPCKEAVASLVLTAPTPSISYRELAFPVSFSDEHLKILRCQFVYQSCFAII